MVICPITVTYNHVSIFLCSRTKKAFNLNYQVEQYLRFLNSPICLEFLSSPGNFNFFRKFVIWWQLKSAAHVTTRLIFLELTHTKIFLSKHRLWDGSLVVIAWNVNWMFCGSLLLLWFFPKLVGWLHVPSEWHITTYLYFFAQERKKLLIKLPSRAIFAISKFPYLFRIAQLTRKFQFLSQICQMVTSTISGIHVTTRLIFHELTHSTIFLS